MKRDPLIKKMVVSHNRTTTALGYRIGAKKYITSATLLVPTETAQIIEINSLILAYCQSRLYKPNNEKMNR